MTVHETIGEGRIEDEHSQASGWWTAERTRTAGLAGLLGGVLWAALPLGTPFFFANLWETGTMDLLGRIYAVYAVIPLALLIVGLVGLHTLHKGHYARLGTAGFTLSLGALSLMAIGLPMDGIAYGTAISGIGHMAFLIGFLLSIIGSIALGLAIRRARILPHARTIGAVFSVAIPAGIAVQIIGSSVMPLGGDLWFWIGLMMAYGLAWIALGYDLQARQTDTPRAEVTPQ